MNDWQPIESAPKSNCREKLYILAVDSKGRMSIGYLLKYSDEKIIQFASAKPIGRPTHWMHLPEPPKS